MFGEPDISLVTFILGKKMNTVTDSKLNFKDLIAKVRAVSGSILKIKDLNFENIILFYLQLAV